MYAPGDLIKVANEKNSIVEVTEVHEWGVQGWELEGPAQRRSPRMFRSIDNERIERKVS